MCSLEHPTALEMVLQPCLAPRHYNLYTLYTYVGAFLNHIESITFAIYPVKFETSMILDAPLSPRQGA